MSMTNEKRNSIKRYIMEKIFSGSKEYVREASEAFGVSKQTIYSYLKSMEQQGIITKKENRGYALVSFQDDFFHYDLSDKAIYEDAVYDEVFKKYTGRMNNNAIKIWQYAFTEMVNNVLDHSESDSLFVAIEQNALYTWVNIVDYGIGIFNKIMKFYDYTDIDDAILSLFKGKLTTDAENHSGEGIFFTSRVMDEYFAVSSQKIFSHTEVSDSTNNVAELIAEDSRIGDLVENCGTIIVMGLVNEPNKTLREVFDMFSHDDSFDTTRIPMQQVSVSGYPVSRSQAKRVYFGLEKFKKVIFDYTGVDDLGQGFAHELYVVYKKKHPNIEFENANASENVLRMINHVQNSAAE